MENDDRLTKKKAKVSSVSINRILPEELLVNIISRLPLKEAARTSVLSHDWKNLWKYYAGCIDIDVVTEIEPETGIELERIVVDYEAVLKIRRARNQRRYLKACKNSDLVNQILLQSHLQAPSVQGLRISVDLDDTCVDSFDRWIDFAIRKRVQSLELDLAPLVQRVPDRRVISQVCYKFPLDLDRSFDALTSLTLKSVDLSEQALSYFLSDNCPHLQHLRLVGIPEITHICVVGRSTLKLRNLEIIYCFELKVVKVVSAPNFSSLRYEGYPVDMILEDVPRFSLLTVGDNHCNCVMYKLEKKLPSCIFSQIERLVLVIPHPAEGRYMSPNQKFPEFRNLKELEVKLRCYTHKCMLFIGYFVQASPILRKLELKYTIVPPPLNWIDRNDSNPPKRRHDNLKVVELMGWSGLETDNLFARYLCEISASLEKMIIDPYNPFDVKKIRPIDPCLIDAARESATLLSTQLPKGARLIIL